MLCSLCKCIQICVCLCVWQRETVSQNKVQFVCASIQIDNTSGGWCTYICIYVCVYINKYVSIYYIYMYTHTYTHTYMCHPYITSMHIHIYMQYIHIYTVFIYIHACVYICTYTCIHTFTHTYVHTCSHRYMSQSHPAITERLPVVSLGDGVSCGGVEGRRVWALTCWGHRRRGTESINGVTVSEKRRADVIAMCAGGIAAQERGAQPAQLPL